MTEASEASGACHEAARVHALADGELSAADAQDVRDHLATCAACQAELAEVMLLEASTAAAGIGEAAPAAPVISLAWYRRRSRQLAVAGFAVAAAAAIYLALPRSGGGGDAVAAIELAPRRGFEPRLAWAGAARHRIYDVPRAGGAGGEPISLAAMAALEQRGDAHGVGALALLGGELGTAARSLARAPESPDVLADRAALALAEHEPARARDLARAALAAQPEHPVALWNLALALRDLGARAESAAAFRAVAARGEPGWADEARQRADALAP